MDYVPDVGFVASGATYTFDFEAYEGRTPQWKRLMRAGLRGFQLGAEVGAAEGANHLTAGLRRIRQVMRQRPLAERIWKDRHKSFTPDETRLLDKFFGSKGKVLPKGLSEETLRKYRKLAEAAQLLEKDTVHTQEIRQKWIDEILKSLKSGSARK